MLNELAFGLSFTSNFSKSRLGQNEVGLVFNESLPSLSGITDELKATPSGLMFVVSGTAQYDITPTMISITPTQDADQKTMLLYLFGSAMGAVLHMRDVLVLHGSSVRLPDGGVAVFTGASTAGKSTLATSLAQKGYAPLADDITAIRFDEDGQAWVYPGLARCKLWPDAMEKLSVPVEAGEKISPDLDKYILPLATWPEPEPVKYVYELLPNEDSAVQRLPVTGIEKMRLIARQTYRPYFVQILGLESRHLQRVGQLAPQIVVSQITRPTGHGSTLDAIIGLLEEEWQQNSL